MHANALFTLEEFKTWLKAGDGVDELRLDLAGDAASAFCESRTGRVFRQRAKTFIRNGDNTSKLLRLFYPIVSVQSLLIDGVEVPADDYVIFAEAGKIELKSRIFPRGVGNVGGTYTAGLAPTDPEFLQVRAAAMDLAKAHYEELTNGTISVSSINVGPISTVIRPGLNPRIEKYLDSIRDVRG